MKKNNPFFSGNNLNFRETIIVAIVVSFVTAIAAGFVAGTVGYNIFGKIKATDFLKQPESVNSKITDETLSALSHEQAVVGVVGKVSPSVVSIVVTKDVPIMEQYYENPFDDDFFQQFFGDDFLPFSIPQYRQQGTEEKEIGGGTGFIISSSPDKGSLIITNKHVVIDEEADYTVFTNEGDKFSAEVIARDPVQDIAILKIDKNDLPAVELGNSDELKIGQSVITIGNALGEFRNTVSAGVVSGLRRSVTAGSAFGGTEELSEVIQTDAAINQGNSGGPLVNLYGQVVGINVAMAIGAENIGFALPINVAKRDIEQIQKEGKISYPFLGVRYILISPEIKKELNLSVDYGALIVRGEERGEFAVIPSGPADKAGLEENDIILEVSGERIAVENPLSKLIQKYKVGETIELKVLHKGNEKTVKVELGERE